MHRGGRFGVRTTLTFCSITTLMSASLSVAASSVCASTWFTVNDFCVLCVEFMVEGLWFMIDSLRVWGVVCWALC